MIIDFQHHYTPPELIEDKGVATTRLNENKEAGQHRRPTEFRQCADDYAVIARRALSSSTAAVR
jgi:hypothetical protein